jgi:hypothetical protein
MLGKFPTSDLFWNTVLHPEIKQGGQLARLALLPKIPDYGTLSTCHNILEYKSYGNIIFRSLFWFIGIPTLENSINAIYMEGKCQFSSPSKNLSTL